MNFKKCTAGVEDYGTDFEPVKKQLKNVSFNDTNLETQIDNKQVSEDVHTFLLGLALNHSIIIDRETREYNAASPDELALVNFAK